MARFCPLFSGSSGNCTYIGTSDGGMLVDTGVSARRIENALKSRDIDPQSIHSIFITHEHTDHINGLRVLVKRFGYKVYASQGTMDALIDKQILTYENDFEILPLQGNGQMSMFKQIDIADVGVTAFETSHDSAQCTGFRIETPDNRVFGIVTDTGYITDNIRASLEGCDLVHIESNYDKEMLDQGPYPYFLKNRIKRDTGHLSNKSCADELPQLAKSGTTRFVLAHLSKENNQPKIAYQTALKSLENEGIRQDVDFILKVAPRDDEAPVMIV